MSTTVHPTASTTTGRDLRLDVGTPELQPAVTQRLVFRVTDSRGLTVRDFEVEHERRMHAIVVRRDLADFHHLHPSMETDGTWSAEVRFDEPGPYRLFADFSAGGTPVTLGADLRVRGRAAKRPLPPPQPTARTSGGYEVRLQAGAVRPGEHATLRFAVTAHGLPVAVESFLGAGGHLVALREGDLAFLHVHPEEHRDGDATIAFHAAFPTTGRYRLFLQFQVAGELQTIAFTQEVA